MVKNCYSRLGFAPFDLGDYWNLWRLEVDTFVPTDTPIEVVTTEAIRPRMRLARDREQAYPGEGARS